ncbi:MAG: DUF4159 domain-containing protein, partial [Anaerolineaceae bacterium]|nr:DUF4159 domain-containing protein [Anaerolineaceae bacterium]
MLVLLSGMIVLLSTAALLRAEVTDAEVRQCIARAVVRLKAGQKTDGQWQMMPDKYGGQYGGVTALAVLALLQAGQPVDDAVVAKGLRALEATPNSDTYVVSLRLMALLKADQVSARPRYRKLVRQAVRWLEQSQTRIGTWGYNRRWARSMADRKPETGTDNSNTQMALLALYEAAKAGYKVNDQVWKRSEAYYARTQNSDGGWGYRSGPRYESYGSMTAAGLASLLVTGSRLHEGMQYKCGSPERTKQCGKYRQVQPIAQALAWLDKNFAVDHHPGQGTQWHYYYLYAMERVGIISGLKTIGRHDWFREGAEFLVRRQSQDGGFRRTGRIGGQVREYDIAFAILFLAKGHVPVLVNKLRWSSTNTDWNIDRYDAEHLTRWIGDRLNGRPVGWQTVSLSDPLEQWLEAPILLITGRKAPQLTPQQKQKLRKYVEGGGTILADSCCDGKAFIEGMRLLVGELFPEIKLQELPETHPVYHSYQNLPARWKLEGLSFGCRTPVLLSTKDLSCYWEQSDRPGSEPALKIGLNIAAYATALEPLRQPLERVVLVGEGPKIKIERGALYVGKVRHKGDWNSRPKAMDRLLDELRLESGVKTANRVVAVSLSGDRVQRFPVLYMVGHFDPKLSDQEKAGLKRYLDRGGFLLAEACCGMPGFDKGFRALMKELFPDRPLKPIPPDSPLLDGRIGHRIETVKVSRRLAK